MMKLKHLIDNRQLVMDILANWDYDPESLGILDRFRISANAVYPFYRQGALCFLRFAPVEEKEPSFVKAELNFIDYLREHDMRVPQSIPGKNGENMAVCDTRWGQYVAVAFTDVGGIRLDRLEAHTGQLIADYGRTLGTLHKLSREYTPGQSQRPGWNQQLARTESVLREYNAPEKALAEVAILRENLGSLPITPDTYGLIHYDFELDNVFHDPETNQFGVIDFDDSVYHWYTMDIVMTLNNLSEELPEEVHAMAKEAFLRGYSSVMPIDEDLLSIDWLWFRYAGLYQYARCLRAIHEHVDNEPEWMTELRTHLAELMAEHEKWFGR